MIGAAHAGWKGAFGGVIEATVAAMTALGADRANIAAAIGPTIARKSYEVDARFLEAFADADPANERFFADGKPGHHQFDLEGFVLSRVAEAGIARVEALGLDTYANPDRFYSYRRATHRAEPDYGRQISLDRAARRRAERHNCLAPRPDDRLGSAPDPLRETRLTP